MLLKEIVDDEPLDLYHSLSKEEETPQSATTVALET